ncbi:type VII secretion protein EccB [Gordonia malaquae]|uniref:type VII secretion protein EccB n=1 Tax=Gordonia malaquae TaxID=410332 RepID=UPI003019EC5A
MARRSFKHPGARRSTDKLQVSGYKLTVQRIEQALISRDVRDFGSPFDRQRSATWIAVGLVTLMAVGGAVFGWLSPAGKAGDAPILATKAGARFVVVDGRVHPVTNLSSARLITGSNASAKNVSDKELAKFPRGQLMGIPSAPDEMSARADDPVVWAVCSQYDASSALDLTRSDDATTLVVAGEDAAPADALIPDSTAILVSSKTTSITGGDDVRSTWLLQGGRRMQIDSSDNSLLSTLRLTSADLDNAAPVSNEVIAAIPPRATFERPSFTRDGQTSTAMSDYTVGTILTTDGLDEPERWLVLDDGLQHVGTFTAQMMLSTGSQAFRGVSKQTVDEAPHTTDDELDGWPWTVPTIKSDATSVCYRWSRTGTGQIRGAFAAGPGLPVSSGARKDAAWLLPARTRTPQADAFYTTPGRGWLVTASGSTDKSLVEGQLWWVADNGVRYALAGDADTSIDQVIGQLGLGSTQPTPVPWPTLQLLPAGNTLSPENARVVHATIPIDQAQGPAPEGKELN